MPIASHAAPAAGSPRPITQVAHIEMEMSRLARAVRDLVHVDVERARSGGMQLHLEGRLLARLSNRRRLERDVVGLDVAAGLQ